MESVTRTDRENELKSLLAQIEAHPERDWSEARERIVVLRETLKDHSPADS